MIPQEKSEGVIRALHTAFGTAALDDICGMTKGLSSALVVRIVVQGSPYLLRIITRTDAVNDPTRQFACMKAAADAGIAPRVLYTSIEDRISITDFVEAAAFSAAEAHARMPGVLRTLHSLPSFPRTVNYFDFVEGFVKRFQAANILPRTVTDDVFTRYARVAIAYPREGPDMVSSHNDLKPENTLFDGRQVWLVDWEAAFLNDRYFDVGVVANFAVADGADEHTYLHEYFGQSPDEYQLARIFLMRQVIHMSYSMVFFILGSSRETVTLSEVDDFEEFHRRIWCGEIDLRDNRAKTAYAKVHWHRMTQNMQQERFEEALRIVSDRRPPI
jgi:thiamine kinase-like enzyme